MTSDDEELIPISALQHLIFCERQAALIHVERIWEDNPYTLDGKYGHRRVDSKRPRLEKRGDVVIIRGLWLRSERLGLIGRPDVVEIHRSVESTVERGESGDWVGKDTCPVDGLPGHWRFFPVEYKRGKPKAHRADEVQLCAQAMCIEEMMDIEVPCGALFYGKTKRRIGVNFDSDLRETVERAATRMRHLIDEGETPGPIFDKRCLNCSLEGACKSCVPPGHPEAGYFDRLINDTIGEA
ncbi:MAG: CRISPR-associated protein Cas4 [Candidatus Krumholzibacteriia bacterium]